LKGRVASHDVVCHSKDEYARRGGGKLITTNSVESFFAILKRGHYGVYHHWSKKYLRQYLREFDWRYNVRAVPDVERTAILLKMVGGKRLLLRKPAEN
jgi:hypothetical protein